MEYFYCVLDFDGVKLVKKVTLYFYETYELDYRDKNNFTHQRRDTQS